MSVEGGIPLGDCGEGDRNVGGEQYQPARSLSFRSRNLKKATLPCFPAAGTVCVQKSCHLLASQMLYSLGSISKLQKLELGFHLLFFIRV